MFVSQGIRRPFRGIIPYIKTYRLFDFVSFVLESQMFFVILTKHISLERSDSQGFIFGHCFVIAVIL